MKRLTILLLGLGVVLILVLWYLLLWTPRAEELEVVEQDITDVQAQQATTRSRIATLEGVREQAPQLQAELAAAESLLPRDTALPAALRQLQQAADESGATLVSVSPTRPELLDPDLDDLYGLNVTTQLRGSYFQIVDVLRRLEDPAISPRGFVWDNAQVGVDEYPTLSVTLGGRMFAVLPQPPAPETTPDEPDGVPDTTDEADDADVEVDVEVEP